MRTPFGLFEVCGLEIEYMIADRETRNVLSIADRVLDALAGSRPDGESRTGDGAVEWSNELVNHVIEAKCRLPVPAPEAMLAPLRRGVAEVNALLAPLGAFLLPSAAHPWMDPKADAMLYPRDEEGIYREYDRIFGCTTHGWTNLQSVHVNLPFADAEEFGRLHAAIRVVLPLIPAIAAASPYLDGVFTGRMDARMGYYRTNSSRVPSMTGPLIPEPVYTPEAYRRDILERIYRETAPLDPRGILRDEWANARAAIARFDRNAIEIRVMDSQECPTADLALAHAVIQVTRLLAEERFASQADLRARDTGRLYAAFFAAVDDAERAVIPDADYAALFGCPAGATFRDVWARLFSLPELEHPLFSPVYEHLLAEGPLARRLVTRCGSAPRRAELAALVDELGRCLAEDRLLTARAARVTPPSHRPSGD